MGKLTGKHRSPRVCNGKKAQYFDDVVRLYHEEGLNGLDISRIIPVHNSTIYHWLDEHDLQNKGNKPAMRKEDINRDSRAPQRAVGVVAPQTSRSSVDASKNVTILGKECTDEVSVLRERVRELERQLATKEKELKTTQLRADLYNEIINVAEEKYRVPIRKKLAPSNREPACTIFKGLSH